MSCLVWDNTKSTLGSLAAMAWISFILRSTVAESVGSQRASTASLTCWMVAASVSGSGRQPSKPSNWGPHLALLGSAAPPGWGTLLEEVCCSPCVASPRALLLLAKPRHLSLVEVGGWGCFQDTLGFLSCALPKRRRDVGTAVAAKCLCHRKLWA